jgi:hypothetical protein
VASARTASPQRSRRTHEGSRSVAPSRSGGAVSARRAARARVEREVRRWLTA